MYVEEINKEWLARNIYKMQNNGSWYRRDGFSFTQAYLTIIAAIKHNDTPLSKARLVAYIGHNSAYNSLILRLFMNICDVLKIPYEINKNQKQLLINKTLIRFSTSIEYRSAVFRGFNGRQLFVYDDYIFPENPNLNGNV